MQLWKQLHLCKHDGRTLFLKTTHVTVTYMYSSLEPWPLSPRFYLQGCEIKSAQGMPGFEATAVHAQ